MSYFHYTTIPLCPNAVNFIWNYNNCSMHTYVQAKISNFCGWTSMVVFPNWEIAVNSSLANIGKVTVTTDVVHVDVQPTLTQLRNSQLIMCKRQIDCVIS